MRRGSRGTARPAPRVPATPPIAWSRVERDPRWEAATAYVVGGGPSLEGHEAGLRTLRERPGSVVVGCNRVGEEIPCDALVSVDRNYIRNRQARLAEIAESGVEVYAVLPRDHREAPIPGVRYVERRQGTAFDLSGDGITNGLHTGYAAVNLALAKGARDVVLLGFDLTIPRGRSPHWHGGYAWAGATCALTYFGAYAQRLDQAARYLPAGIRVRNANPASAVRGFEFTTYAEVGL